MSKNTHTHVHTKDVTKMCFVSVAVLIEWTVSERTSRQGLISMKRIIVNILWMWIKWINFNNKCLLFVYVVGLFRVILLTFTKWNAEFCETDCRHSTMLNGNARRTFSCIWKVFLFVFEKFRRFVGASSGVCVWLYCLLLPWLVFYFRVILFRHFRQKTRKNYE